VSFNVFRPNIYMIILKNSLNYELLKTTERDFCGVGNYGNRVTTIMKVEYGA
jgi:hypothetical protein